MDKQVTTWYLIKVKGEKFCVKVEHFISNVYSAKKEMMKKFEISQLDIITSSSDLVNPWPDEKCIIFNGKNL